MKLGVFDSGIGGKAIADSLAQDFPSAKIIYVHDAEHMPYGGREREEIIALTESALEPLFEAACDCIVLACNTATAAAIEYLREKYPSQKFIGLEPMIKPAVELSKTGVIAVCATPYTLSSNRYKDLKETFATDITVIEPNCSSWAAMIEHDAVDEAAVERIVDESIQNGADVIVLACTHYHWIKDTIVSRAGSRATVLDPSEAVSRQVATLLGHNFVA